jgi:hypothetical protein
MLSLTHDLGDGGWGGDLGEQMPQAQSNRRSEALYLLCSFYRVRSIVNTFFL